MKYLPEGRKIDPCFLALGFTKIPDSEEEIKSQYKKMAKIMHPDAGGNEESFKSLTINYEKCLGILEENKVG